MSKLPGGSTFGPTWAGRASTIRSRRRRVRPSMESASRGPPSPPRRKTRNLSLRTLITATMSRAPRGPASRSAARARANPRSSSSKACQPCTGSMWPSAPRPRYTRPRVPRSSMSRRTSSSTATRVGRPVLESTTWFLKRSHSARRRKYSSFAEGGAVMGREDARKGSTCRLSPLTQLAEDGLDLAEQLLQREGLADVVDRPFLQALHAVLGLRARGKHGHRDVRRLVVHAQQLQDLPPVHLRHHDVEEHEVRLLDLGRGQGLVPVG